MNGLRLLPVLAFAVPVLAAAQYPRESPVQFHHTAPMLAACPVGFSVMRSSATELLRAGDAPPTPDSQQIDLRFQPPADRELRSVEVVVHVFAREAYLLPTTGPGSSRVGPRLDDRSIHLDLDRDARLRRLTLAHVGGVVSVDLMALQFVDGSSWRSSAEARCRAVPSLLLEVSSR